MTSQEIAASNNRAAALRTEGRRARTQVLEAVAQMWEVVDIVRADARLVGVEMHTPMKRMFVRGMYVCNTVICSTAARVGHLDDDTAVLGLEEALAVPELVEALTSFRAVVDFIREIPRNKVELETAVKRIEQDKVT
jgi:hypothetical protein